LYSKKEGRKMGRKEDVSRTDKRFALILLLPSLIILIFLGLYPIGSVGWLSFFKKSLFPFPEEFVGLQNYIQIINSSWFWGAVSKSLIWTAGNIIVQLPFSIIVALILHKEFYGRNIVRGVVMFSYLLPMVIVALVWRFLLNDIVGVVNIFPAPFDKLSMAFSSREWAMITVIFISSWRYFPFMVINFLARLQTIDISLYEAADIDGASFWGKFVYITLPMLKPVIYIVLLLRSIWTIKNYEVIALLTNGGPVRSTTTLPIQIFETTFNDYKLGRGSAIAVVMFIIILIFSFGYIKLYNKAEEELE
jgi:multiple sugar transport system permease protein